MSTITDDIREDILTGRFEPGDRLLEVPLSEQYACGRAAVRTALVALTAEGLVEHEVNRGATVRRITVEGAIQITQARAAIESLIASEAARHTTAADHRELTGIIDDMRAAVEADRGGDYSALNGLFHQRLSEMSGHEVAAELVANLRNRAAHHQYRLAIMPDRPVESLAQHAAIVEAVLASDEAAAADAMRAHLESVIEVLQRWAELA